IDEFGIPQVGSTAQVSSAEISFVEICQYVWMLFPPLIPSIYPLFEDIELFLVCHHVVSSFLIFYHLGGSVNRLSQRWGDTSIRRFHQPILLCHLPGEFLH